MGYLEIIGIVTLGLFTLHKFCLFLERKGWLYYRHKSPSGGGIGNALQEFEAFLNPSSRQVIEVVQKDSKQQDDQGDDKDPRGKAVDRKPVATGSRPVDW